MFILRYNIIIVTNLCICLSLFVEIIAARHNIYDIQNQAKTLFINFTKSGFNKLKK